MNRILGMTGFILTVGIGVASIIGSNGGSSSEPEPRFTVFTVDSEVCLNTTLPLIRIHYEFDPDGWNNPNTLCTDVLADGQKIHVQNHHQCLDDGTVGDLTFDPLQFYGGADVPPTITVSVELVPSVAGDTYDTRSGTVTTRTDCPPPGTVPGP